MNRKATSIWLSALLIGTLFTVVFMGTVNAMNDEQNLSGLVWQADGSQPTQSTNFCIWVSHGGTWYRFPETGFAQTQVDIYGNYWYSYVLPDEYSATSSDDRWGDGDTYRVQVDGTPWFNFDGNATSNGTGSAGDPIPPYDPLSEIDNTINFAAGGGFANEQQWDVRTVAPLDIAPTNITADGKLPVDYLFGIPVPPDTDIEIFFNITNFGLIPTGPFDYILWNCTDTGVNIGSFLYQITHPGLPGSGDSGVLGPFIWHSPNQPGDFYVNITVDSGFAIPEYNEINNTFILHFLIGPDLVPVNVQVDGLLPTDPIYIGPGEMAVIINDVQNVGFSAVGGPTITALYETTGPGGPEIPVTRQENTTIDLLPGEIFSFHAWYWTAPTTAGDYYLNISVDYYNVSWEASETNNHYNLHFFVGPDLTPNNVTVDYVPVVGFVIINPLVFYDIGVNATNIGLTSTGTSIFRITYAECDAAGTPIAAPFNESGDLPPFTLQPGDSTPDVYGQWQAPLFTGQLDYYINITVDYYDTTSETDEGNNYYILQLRMDAPDLTPYTINVWVGGSIVATFNTIPPYISSIVEVPRGVDVTIEIIVTNIGGVASGPTNVTFYNISGVGGPPIDDPFDQPTLPGIPPGGFETVTGFWVNPGVDGMFYINISIDFNGTDINGNVLELNEYNNYYTLIINTTPIPITYFLPNQPYLFNSTGNAYYITNATEIVLNSQGGTPPRYTYYRVLWANNLTQALGWTNYTGMPFFTIAYGEFAYAVEYYTFDSVGALETTKTSYVIVDDSPPDTTLTVDNPRYRVSGIDNWNITRDTPIQLSATDNPLGIDITLLINNAAGIDNPFKPESGIFYRITGGFGTTDWFEGSTFTMDPAWLDGFYLIEYNSTDNLGNMEPTKSITVYLDNTGPATNIDVGYLKYPDAAVPTHVKSDTPYTLSGDDGPGCGVNTSTFRFRIVNQDTGNGIPWTPGASFDIATAYPTFEGDGNYTIYFYSSDWLGNSGNQGTIDLYVDETPPFVTLAVDTPSFRANTSDMWNITDTTRLRLTGATDGPGCGVNVTEYHIFNATTDWGWQQYGEPFYLSGFENGEYTIEYRITDFLDNSRTMSENVFLDSTPPTTDIVIGDPKYPTVPTLNITSATTITLTWDDIGTGVNVTWYEITTSTGEQKVDPTPYTGPFTLDGLDDDEYEIFYYSEDKLANIEGVNTYIVYLDNTGPTVDITGGQTDWNPDENAWNVDFDVFFRLQADDGPGSGVDIIEYRIDGSPTWLTYTAQFNLTLNDHGYWDHTIEFRARDNVDNYGPTGSLEIYIEGDLTPPDPPVLRLFVQDDNILLDWDHSPDPDVHHYLIYRSATKTGFDFTNVWVDSDVASDPVNGILALRSQWNDTGAVSESTEFYYAIRGVDQRGNIGSPSNIAGKVTMTFTSGYNTFALPLEPFDDMTASGMLSEDVFADTTDTIYRYDTESQQWMGKPKFLPSSLNDFDIMMGEGYMLNVKETAVEYTFTGAVATSIRYRGGVGDEDSFRNSLDVSAAANSVELSWETATDATGYSIYRAETRMGTGSLTDFTLAPLVEVGETTTTYTDNTATGDEYHYMVVAQVGGVDSSGTYAVGVRTISYSEGYTLMSLELEPIIDDPSLAYYVDDMFNDDTSTLYYYDGNSAVWQGHPGFMPENMNNPDVGTGAAYLVFVYDQGVGYTFSGI